MRSGMAMLPGLVLERPLFRRERADGLFLPATYLAHKLSEEVLGFDVCFTPDVHGASDVFFRHPALLLSRKHAGYHLSLHGLAAACLKECIADTPALC